MKEYLEIKNLSCGYSKSFQLSDVSFSIPKGVFAGITGPNGSGKTTLFRGITGDISVSTGNIELNKQSLLDMSIKDRAQNIAVVSQFFEPVEITVAEYVLMGRIPYRSQFQFFESDEDYTIAESYMKHTGIYHLRNKHMNRLSGGEQQLASIARALTQKPKVLLLDEPTSHLDITHQVRILNLIQNLSHTHELTILMIIHDLNLAGEFCDFLIMMKEGKVFTKGSPKEVLTYKNIESVYDTVVVTQSNPLSGNPAVFLVSDKVLKHS